VLVSNRSRMCREKANMDYLCSVLTPRRVRRVRIARDGSGEMPNSRPNNTTMHARKVDREIKTLRCNMIRTTCSYSEDREQNR
jgi:hypothetical protein